MSAVMDGTDFTDATAPALLRLFSENYDRLVAYFRSRISGRDEALDLVHDVFLKLMEIPADRVIDNPRAYLWTMARNELFHHLQRTGRARAADVEDPAFEAQLAQHPTFDADIDDQSRLSLLREKLPLLPPKCAAVMELRWKHEMSNEEIASRTGISVNTVKKHEKKGLVHLRRHMQGLE